MFQLRWKNFVGFGIDLLAAAALTGVGILFHMIVHHGSALTLVELPVLAIAVLAILTAYNWLFNKADEFEAETHRPQTLEPSG